MNRTGSALSVLLLLATFAPRASAQTCRPAAEKWLGTSLLESLPQAAQMERKNAVGIAAGVELR